MNKKRFKKLVENPFLIKDKDVEDFKIFLERYPFFQLAYSLMSKYMHIKNTPSKKKSLELAAIYSSDRTKLKELIKKKNISTQEITHIDSKTTESEPVPNDNRVKINLLSDVDDEKQDDLSKNNQYISEEMITENLAKIMIDQEKYSEAIEIFHQLKLKLPEKKAYFTKIINKLKSI